MKKILWILPLLLLAMSCIHEDDDDDCPVQPVKSSLYFSYLGDINREIFPSKIQSVNLYVYDQNDKQVEHRVISHAELKTYQGVDLALPIGLYQVVCWGNAFTNTTILNSTDRLAAELSHPQYYATQPIAGNDSLYYVYQKVYIPDPKHTVADTLYFRGAHIKFHVYLHGSYLDGNKNAYRIRVNQLPPTYNFMMQNNHSLVSYLPSGVPEVTGGAFGYHFNTLRIADDNPVTIELIDTNTDKPFYTLPLKEYMQRNNIHVNNLNEAVIPVHFSISSTGVKVLPWEDEDLKPEI